MEKYSQMSLLEIAIELMEQKRVPHSIRNIIKEVLEIKGVEDEDFVLATQLYIDITTSSKFVYMGEENWDLKSRQSLDEYDKDGSAYNPKDSKEEATDEINDIEEPIENYEDLELDDENEDDDRYEDRDYEDEDDFDDENEEEYDELDDESIIDDEFIERYDEDDFNEDRYNDLMDDYEDMYE